MKERGTFYLVWWPGRAQFGFHRDRNCCRWRFNLGKFAVGRYWG